MPTRRALLAGLGAAGLSAALVGFSRKGRTARPVTLALAAQPTKDGAGVRLARAIGSRELRMLDPFLLLDEFKSEDADDYIKGFPDHPHRGFETVTVMLAGAMEHRDSVGNRGLLGPGSVQWMTAGRGLVHSEMPKQQDGKMWGFQLWVNLPARQKMIPPRYQDLAPGTVPEVDVDEARARVLAGALNGVTGPVQGVVVAPTVLDLTIPAGGRFRTDTVPVTHTAFAYVTEGSVAFGETPSRVEGGTLAVLGAGETIDARADRDTRLLLVAGAPIGEPVARRGPFVMNSDEEIRQAYEDYRTGRLVSG